MKRRLLETMGEDAASASSAAKRLAPSGSLASRELYAGSRRENQRYEYSIKSKAAFVELHQGWYPHQSEGPQLFKELLEKVEGVGRVRWNTSKTSQGNKGNHYCKRNLFVYSQMLGPAYVHKPIEFELTRHQHTDDPKVKPTLTAMFKDPPNGMVGEAWRILLLATKGKQLLPVHAQDYCARHLARWQRDESHAPVFDSAQSSVEAEAGTDGQHSATRWTRSGHGMRVREGGAATEKNLTPSVSPGELAVEDPTRCRRAGAPHSRFLNAARCRGT